MYSNSLPPSRLFGIALLLFGISGLLLWGIGVMDPESTAFDSGSLILLGASIGLLILSLLFLRRARGVRIVTSILLHLAGLVLLATLPLTVPTIETTLDKMIPVILTLLGVGLLFLAILVLHSIAMKNDFAAIREQVHPRRKRSYLAAAAGAVLLLVAVAAWQIVPLLVAQPTITVDYLAQANQANKPVDYDPNRNAAPHYEKLFSQFTALPEILKDKVKSWPTDLNPDEFKALEEWAPLNEPTLSALAQAVRCPYWWYELKSPDGALSGIQVPDHDRIRSCACGVLLLAKCAAAQDDTERGLRLLTDLHMLGVHQVKGATLLEHLTGLAICELSYDGVLAVLSHCRVKIDTLRLALDMFTQRIPQIVVPRFSEVEHLYGQDNIQRAFTDDGRGNGRLIPAQLYRVKKNRAKLYTYPIPYLDAVRICLTHPDRQETLQLGELYFAFVKDLAKQTPWDLYAKATSHEKRLKELLSGNYYLQDSLSGIGPCIRVGWRNRVTGEATTAILAVFVYKAREGRLPASFKELMDKGLLPSVPMDPYSGAPLLYKVDGDDFTLYSVGEDFIDDGGLPCEWNDESGGDHVFWPASRA